MLVPDGDGAALLVGRLGRTGVDARAAADDADGEETKGEKVPEKLSLKGHSATVRKVGADQGLEKTEANRSTKALCRRAG